MIKQLATALALSCALVTPALAQATSTWRDTEGNVHTETTPNDMAHVKGDPKYRSIIAVARVFYWGFRLINRMVPGSFSVQDENSATLGLDSTTRDPYTVKQFSADYPCQFDLKKGRDNKLAEIHFDRLTDKVEPVASYGPGYAAVVYGRGNAVCWRGSRNGALGDGERNSRFCAAGLTVVLWSPEQISQLQDALTYIFDNHICEPAEMPARAQ